jgi:hypothetical protein
MDKLGDYWSLGCLVTLSVFKRASIKQRGFESHFLGQHVHKTIKIKTLISLLEKNSSNRYI